MIDQIKIARLQKKIKEAVREIEKEEMVSIEFGSGKYTPAVLTTTLRITTLDKSEKVANVLLNECKALGFTQNIIGFEFTSPTLGQVKVIDIKLRNRKYPIIVKTKGDKNYKLSASSVKLHMGGDKIINRNANLDKLFG